MQVVHVYVYGAMTGKNFLKKGSGSVMTYEVQTQNQVFLLKLEKARILGRSSSKIRKCTSPISTEREKSMPNTTPNCHAPAFTPAPTWRISSISVGSRNKAKPIRSAADKKLALVAVEDIGKCACAIFQDPSLIGKSVGVMSDALTGTEIAATFNKVTGKTVQYNPVPVEVYASFGFPGCEDLANMFRYYEENETEFLKARDIPKSVLKNMGGIVNFEEYVTANKAAF